MDHQQCGGVPKRLKGSVLKTDSGGNSSKSSNLFASAIIIKSASKNGTFYFEFVMPKWHRNTMLRSQNATSKHSSMVVPFSINICYHMVARRTKMAFNQKEYIDSYNKKNYKQFSFRIRKDDEKVIEKLLEVPSMNQYIHSLIDSDINPSVLTIKQIKERVSPVLSKHDIHEVYLFGSYARGEAKSNSDVDIYCEAGDIKSFIDQGFLEDELSKALGKDVDIVFIGSKMDDFFKKQLEEDKIRIF